MTGRLDEVELPELVQLFASGRRSVRIEVITTDNQRGRVYVEHGEVTECRFGDLLGEEAFFGLFEAGGRFMVYRFDPERSRRAMVSRGWQELILEAARRQDEAQRETDHGGAEDAAEDGLDNVLQLPLGQNADIVSRADEVRAERGSASPAPPETPTPDTTPTAQPVTERSTTEVGDDAPPANLFDETFAAAMRAYLIRDLDEANALFLRCNDLRPGDPRVAANLKRLESMRSKR